MIGVVAALAFAAISCTIILGVMSTISVHYPWVRLTAISVH